MATDESPNAAPQSIDSNAVRSAAIVIIIVMSIAALKLGRPVVLPIVIAVLLSLLLSTPVRWLRKRRIPERFGAAIVVFGALGVAIGAGALLIRPAIDWIASAPATIAKVDSKIRAISKPIVALQQSADKMATVTIQEAQAKLPDLIHKLMPGDEVVITENNQPVATLVSKLPKAKAGLRPPPGLGKGFITILSDDDEHLKDFADYMP